jgi:hypothetical protein
VHAQGRVTAGDNDPIRDRHPAQGTRDEQVRAPLEPEESEIERSTSLRHGVYCAAVTPPRAS